MIAIIAAMSPNHAIGNKGSLPWHLPEDLARFRQLTMGNTIIMGRKTFESLPNGALPGRRNIVLSKTNKEIRGCEVCASLEEALKLCHGKPTFIIGGELVYRQTMPVADTLHITLVEENPAEADTFFPDIDMGTWLETERDKRHGFSFLTFTRRKSTNKETP